MKITIAAVLMLTLCAPAIAAPAKKSGRRVLMTFYWVIDEASSKYHGKRSTVLRDPAGNEIARTTRKFKRDLVVQGSAWLRDGRTIIYVDRVHGEHRFRIAPTRYGLGHTGCPLIPYRTIAVDPRVIPIGARVYIPQLKGAHMPDGTTHDGFFIAADRGIFHGAHIDMFTGAGPRSARPFIRRGYGSRSHVTVRIEGMASGCTP